MRHAQMHYQKFQRLTTTAWPVFFSKLAVHKQASFFSTQFPTTVDLNLLGRCNLNCAWCWGPEHDAAEPIHLDKWKELIKKLHQLGTTSVIITGGEPLLKRWLPDLIKYIKLDLNMRVTLSTNGILLRQKANSLLPYIDDLGIPIDGLSDEVNKLMRVGKFKHFDIVLDTIKYVQAQYPRIDLTVRTVVAKRNLEFVPEIGMTLLHSGVNPEKIRWKLYQVNPIGPRKKDILSGDWLISLNDFNRIVDKSRYAYGEIRVARFN